MRVLILTIVLILLSSSLMAQADNVAPVVWQRYKVSAKNISFNLPKLPTALVGGDVCTQESASTYRAFADGAAYEVSIWSRGNGTPPRGCTRGINRFDQSSLVGRLRDIEDERKFSGNTEMTVDGRPAFRFSSGNVTRVVVSDVEANKRWIELEVVHYPDTSPDIEKFLASLKMGDATGKEIGEGSVVTIGDEGTPVVQQLVLAPVDDSKPGAASAGAGSGVGVGTGTGSGSGSGSGVSEPAKPGTGFMVVAKEKARYTDEARRASVQGTVRLKVTLLANGAIGTVTVVKGLTHGLTENAIYAAKRLVFLPKRVDGKPVTSVVTVEYSFSIY